MKMWKGLLLLLALFFLALSQGYGEREREPPKAMDWNLEPYETNMTIYPVPSYSQRNFSSAEIVSAPGCPTSINGFPFVLYGHPDPKCYLVGEYFPHCKGYMFYKKGSDYGECRKVVPVKVPSSNFTNQPGDCEEGYYYSEVEHNCLKRFDQSSQFYIP